jgi:hypothetical protein
MFLRIRYAWNEFWWQAKAWFRYRKWQLTNVRVPRDQFSPQLELDLEVMMVLSPVKRQEYMTRQGNRRVHYEIRGIVAHKAEHREAIEQLQIRWQEEGRAS